MRWRAHLPIAALAAAWAPGLGAQRTFDGVVTYRSTVEGQPVEFVYMTRGSKVRQETVVPGESVGGRSIVLYDYASGAITTLLPAQRRYTTSPLRAARRGAQAGRRPSSPPTPGAVRATGRVETIAGMSCEVFVFGADAGEACVATNQGHFIAMEGEAGDPGFAAFGRYFKDGALPLRFTFGATSSHPMVFTATKVERRAVPDGLFQIPAGYTPVPNSPRQP